MATPLFLLDSGGVRAGPLVRRLRARFGAGRCLHAGMESPYDLRVPTEVLALPAETLAAGYDLVHGDLRVPEVRARFAALDLSREQLVVLIDEPLQRAARLYGRAWVNPLEPLHDAARRHTFPEFTEAHIPADDQSRRIWDAPTLAAARDLGGPDCLICPLSAAPRLRELARPVPGPVETGEGEITARVLVTLDGSQLARFYRQNAVDLMLWTWAVAAFPKETAHQLHDRWTGAVAA